MDAFEESVTVSENKPEALSLEFEHVDSRNYKVVQNYMLSLIQLSQSQTVIDLSEVGFVDSVGLSTLIQCRQAFQVAGKTLSLTGIQEYVAHYLVVTGLAKALLG